MEKIGLQALLNNAAFAVALKSYMAGVDAMNAKTEQFAKEGSEKMSSAAQTTADSMNNVSSASNKSTEALARLDFRSLLLATTLGQYLYTAINKVVSMIKNLTTAGIMSAARVQELDFVLQLLGERAGWTKQQLDEQTKSIVDFGIRTDVAQNLLSQFIRYELDVTKASALARVAQDTAIIAMEDSSMTLERMIWGIQRYDTMIMRTIGINIDAALAFDKYAAEIGKTSKELSTNEKQQAFLNAVIEEGSRNAGLYEAAMMSAGKQLRSMPRYMYELGKSMGEPFLGAFSKIIFSINNMIKRLQEAFDEGGEFRDMMIRLGAAASLVADYFELFIQKLTDFILKIGSTLGNISDFQSILDRIPAPVLAIVAAFGALVGYLTVVSRTLVFVAKAIGIAKKALLAAKVATLALVNPTVLLVAALGLIAAALITNYGGIRDKIEEAMNSATKAIGKFISNVSRWISEAIESAYEWGVNLINQFATGIANAAKTVLDAVMKWIGNILASWLSPGSPPKIAPNLVKWGIAAVNEWLQGFTQADWSILQGIQAPLKDALGYMVDIGEITQEQSGKAFANLSKAMIKAMATGSGMDKVIQKIRKTAGQFGGEVAKMAEQYFQLNDAIKRVTSAEEALYNARKRQYEAGKAVNDGVREYNKMLREGASEEALAVKLREINASREAQKAAEKEAETAEESLKIAKEEADTVGEQIAQQQKLIDMLLELARAQIKTGEEAAGGAGGGKGPAAAGMEELLGGGGLGEFDPGEFKVEDPFSDLIENMKEDLKAQLAEMWQGIKDKISGWWQGVKDTISGWWNEIKTNIVNGWNEFKGAVAKRIPEIKEDFVVAWEKIKVAAETIWGNIKTAIGTKVEEVKSSIKEKIDKVKEDWNTTWDNVKTSVVTKWNKIKTTVETKVEEVKSSIKEKIDKIKENWDTIWNSIRDRWDGLWDGIRNKVILIWDGIKLFFRNILVRIFAKMGIDLDEFIGKWKKIWDDVKIIAILIWARIKDWIGEKVTEIYNAVSGKIEEIRNWLVTKWNEIKTSVETKWDEIKTSVETKVGEMKAAIETKWNEIKTSVETKWNEIKTSVETKWDEIKTSVETKVGEVKTSIETKVEEIKTAWETKWGEIKATIETVWGEIKTGVETKVGEVASSVGDAISGIWTNVSTWVTDAFNAGVSIIQGIIDGILSKIGGVLTAITDTVGGVISNAKKTLQSESPSKVFVRIGADTMKGMAYGISSSKSLPRRAMSSAVASTASPAISNYHTLSRNNQISFGDTNIYNNMDEALFTQRVLRILSEV